jgi:hypothetical protein
MGIESTKYVSRAWAIERIMFIQGLAATKHYHKLKEATGEEDSTEQMKSFVKGIEIIPEEELDKFTDEMLEEIIDMPYFRNDMFENYLIGIDEDRKYPSYMAEKEYYSDVD